MPARRTRQLAWLGALATAIGAGLIVEWTKDFPILRFAARLVAAGWHWLLAATSIPHWALSLLIVVAAISLVALLSRLVTGIRSPHKRYVNDHFLDIDWHWRYVDGQIYPDHVVPLCPKCALQMTFVDASSYAAVPRTGITCEGCSYSRQFDGDRYALLGHIIKLIERNLRTGAYVQRLGPNAPSPS